jgi:myo-inositol-1(or 4)-monophosphatase
MRQNVILKSMVEAATKAGNVLQKMYKDNSAVSVNKGESYYDVVSEADFQSEDIILKIFAEALPGVSILSEEKGFIDKNSPDTIIIDPLDGSSNFLLGIPHFSVAMAHLHNGEILASVIYNPITENMYVAQKGKGVLLNNKKLKVVSKKELKSIAVNFSHKAVWKEKRRFF